MASEPERQTILRALAVIALMCFSALRANLVTAGDAKVVPEETRMSDQATALAKHVLEIAGRRQGVCAIPRCGDGQLALAVAQNSGFLVHAMDSRTENLGLTRNMAETAGLFGRRLYVEQGTMATLPFADNYVDLLLATDLADADLATISPQGLLRVLSACRGKAVVGRADSGGRLSPAALAAWAKKFQVSNVKVVRDSWGLWAIIQKPPLAGADDWTHSLHGADNNPVSKDAVLKWPYLLQYLAKPYLAPSWGSRTVVAGGRQFTVWSWWCRNASAWKLPSSHLCAYNAYNGQTLWSREVPASHLADEATHRCCLIATGSTVYLLAENKVLCLDAETGDELRSISLEKTGEEGKTMFLSEGVLCVLGGRKDPVVNLPKPYPGSLTALTVKMANRPAAPQWLNCCGHRIGAYDATTGKDLWVHAEEKPADPRAMGSANGKVVFYAENSRIGCLDLRSGKLLWSNAEEAVLAALESLPYPAGGLGSPYGLMCTPEVVYISRGARVALSAADGRLLWKEEKSRRGGRVSASNIFMIEGKLLAPFRGPFPGAYCLLEPLTGNPVQDAKGRPMCISPAWGVCDQKTTLASLYVDGEGRWYDQGTCVKNEHLVQRTVKPPCSTGMIPADGLLLSGPDSCVCDRQIRGFVAYCSANDFALNRPADPQTRLERGTVAPDPVAAWPADAKDWPVERANAMCSGASPVAAPAKPARQWHHTPAHPFVNETWPDTDTLEVEHKPTTAICVKDLICYAGTDGLVHCLDGPTGEQKWSFATAGPVVAAPSFWQGRIYVGSADGCAYALDASTGRLLWRFRGAPEPRRILVYGRLQSSWPVNSGVLVQDGVAYFAAGMFDEMGAHVYALDAKTGGIVWQNNSSGFAFSPEAHRGVTPGGRMVITHGRLWLRTFQGLAICYDLKTGRLETGGNVATWRFANNLPGVGGACGKEIGLLDDRFLVYGGAPLCCDQNELWANNGALNERRGYRFVFTEIDAEGRALYPAIAPVQCNGLIPAWDAKNMLFGTDGVKTLECWDVKKTVEFLGAKRREFSGQKTSFTDYGSAALAELTGRLQTDVMMSARKGRIVPDFPMRQWRFSMEMNAVALTANAVVLTGGIRQQKKQTLLGELLPFAQWLLVALDRRTGSELWREELPSEPLSGGLSVNRDGNLIVMLRDGGVVCVGEKR